MALYYHSISSKLYFNMYYILSNKLRNVKLYVQKLKYPPDIKRREEVIITRAKIVHSHLTHTHILDKRTSTNM